MSNDKSNVASSSVFPDPSTGITFIERRKRLAHLIGRLLARNWLQQRRQTEKGKPSSSDSQDNRGA